MNLEDFDAPDDLVERGSAPDVRTPHSDEVVRVHRSDAVPKKTLLKYNGKFYLVGKAAQKALKKHLFTATLVPASSSDNSQFLWPLKTSVESAAKAAESAKKAWVRVKWDNATRTYRTKPAEGARDEPVWPDGEFNDFVEKAFRSRVITNLNHPVAKKLLGGKGEPSDSTDDE